MPNCRNVLNNSVCRPFRSVASESSDSWIRRDIHNQIVATHCLSSGIKRARGRTVPTFREFFFSDVSANAVRVHYAIRQYNNSGQYRGESAASWPASQHAHPSALSAFVIFTFLRGSLSVWIRSRFICRAVYLGTQLIVHDFGRRTRACVELRGTSQLVHAEEAVVPASRENANKRHRLFLFEWIGLF